ncbi:MAG: hypothetical protein KKH94_03365 [Candidatus Omnitrophica bacterium]|nr:hypothetical protein [Candidatus Omnitrophota bacterium]
MAKKFIRKLIDVEIKLGFLHIPAVGIELMPEKGGRITVVIDGKENKLTYNAKHKRVFGLVRWYKKHNTHVSDEVVFEKRGSKFTLSFKNKTQETPLKEAETLVDISGLSSQAKGDIVEERIKELIVLQGQGLLSVYRPVTDTQGVDLVVTKAGMFQPIFLQIKGRFNVAKVGFFLMDINKKTFTPHHSYFVVGAYFNPQKMEIDENVLLVPSLEVAKGTVVKSKRGESLRIQNHLSPDSQGRWAPFLIKKTDLANKLLEKFEEMARYIK